jgi:uncharacterized protein (DUF302 family)
MVARAKLGAAMRKAGFESARRSMRARTDAAQDPLREALLMSYYISRSTSRPFDTVVGEIIEQLKAEGFGVLTDIDVQATLKNKLGVDFPRYRILGACNPHLAHEVLKLESNLGVMLPCNVIVRETADGHVDVASVDPVQAMERTGNSALAIPAQAVREKLQRAISGLSRR